MCRAPGTMPESEADTCRRYVLPKLYEAGWIDEQFNEQKAFTDGRVVTLSHGITRVSHVPKMQTSRGKLMNAIKLCVVGVVLALTVGRGVASGVIVFWTDPFNGTDAILRADLSAPDPSSTVQEIVTGLRARDVIVDPVDRKIYWATDGGDASVIGRADFDGSNQEALLVGR